MFEKDLRITLLLDTYGDVLDEHTRSVMLAYYDDDLSLSEVAELIGISRQGVRHVIKKGEDQLRFLEERLSLVKRHGELTRAAEVISAVSAAISDSAVDGAEALVASLNSAVDVILNKNG